MDSKTLTHGSNGDQRIPDSKRLKTEANFEPGKSADRGDIAVGAGIVDRNSPVGRNAACVQDIEISGAINCQASRDTQSGASPPTTRIGAASPSAAGSYTVIVLFAAFPA